MDGKLLTNYLLNDRSLHYFLGVREIIKIHRKIL